MAARQRQVYYLRAACRRLNGGENRKSKELGKLPSPLRSVVTLLIIIRPILFIAALSTIKHALCLKKNNYKKQRVGVFFCRHMELDPRQPVTVFPLGCYQTPELCAFPTPAARNIEALSPLPQAFAADAEFLGELRFVH